MNFAYLVCCVFESRFGVLCFLFCVMFSASETLYQSARRAPGKSPRLDRSRGSFRCTKLQLRWNNSTSFNVKKRNAFYFWCCLNIYGSEWKTLFSFDKKKTKFREMIFVMECFSNCTINSHLNISHIDSHAFCLDFNFASEKLKFQSSRKKLVNVRKQLSLGHSMLFPLK